MDQPPEMPSSPSHSHSTLRQPSSLQLLQEQLGPKKWENPLVPEATRAKFRDAQQLDVFQFVDTEGMVTDADVQTLLDDVADVDLDYIKKIYTESLLFDKGAMASLTNCSIEPLDEFDSVLTSSPETIATWRALGYNAINRGEVAAMILAGGQGTRLGFDGPKGMYDIGLLSKKSLFQLFAERVLRIQKNAKKHGRIAHDPVVQLYIMTSRMNHDTTTTFFEENEFFGLKASQVTFFPQGTLPCLTKTGHIMLETPHKIARASDGNGGVFTAMLKHNVLQKMTQANVQHLHVFSVDNALNKVADPVFLGYCIDKQAEIGNKVVWKTNPEEKVGVVAKKDNKFCVVEYSELDAQNAQLVDQTTGKLVYGAGNICNHYFSVPFLTRTLATLDLPYHIAMKNIPSVSLHDTTSKTFPGMKLEAFIFDIFAAATQMAVLEVAREDEFAPVKNANGNTDKGYTVDSPDSARYLLSSQAKRWVEAIGGDLKLHLVTKGELEKQGKRLKRWSKRFVEFDAATNCITTYKSEETKSKKAKTSSVVKCELEEHLGVSVLLGNGKVLKLKCPTEDDQIHWNQVITEALQPNIANERLFEVSPLVSYEGEGLEYLKGRQFSLPCHVSENFARRLSMHVPSFAFVSNSKMKSIVADGTELVVSEVEIAPIVEKTHDIIIETKFAAVTPLDVQLRTKEPDAVPGYAVSGVVSSVGNDVTKFKVGDRVCALVAKTGWNEFVKVQENDCVAKLPLRMPLSLAAQVPVTTLIAQHLKQHVQSGDRVLIVSHGYGDIGYVLPQLCASVGASWIGIWTNQPEKFALLDIPVVSSVAEAQQLAKAATNSDVSLAIDVSLTPQVVGPIKTVTIQNFVGSVPTFTAADLSGMVDRIASDMLSYPSSMVIEKPFASVEMTLKSLSTSVSLRVNIPVIPQTIISKLEEAKQDHVLKFYQAGKLTNSEIDQLIEDLEHLDFDHLGSIFQTSMKSDGAPLTGSLEPLDSTDSISTTPAATLAAWQNIGTEAIRQGKVAALVLSGGQGTRLGFAGPKGMYNIGLPSEKSLFQLFSERILRLEALVGVTGKIPFYIMTSVMNHDTTEVFFKQHEYFGLQASQVMFFPQGTLPCFTKDGKLMLESAGKLATASDGNGGVYTALEKSGALARMKEEGTEYLHVFSVDNAMCKVADPMFIGYCIEKNADCGNKVVWKTRPEESVGIVAKRGGQYCVVEYSEMDKPTSELRDPNTNQLLYGAANICNHFYTVSFLTDVVLPQMSLQYHVAHKKIPMADENGVTVTPTANSGVKLESFIFDVFPLSQRMAVLSSNREDEFSPVKNAPGNPVDSPDSARQMLHDQATRWLKASTSYEYLEISPLVSYAGEGLDAYRADLPFARVLCLDSKSHPANAHCVPTVLRHRLEEFKQQHVLHFIDSGKVSRYEAQLLLQDLATIDFYHLKASFERSMHGSDGVDTTGALAPLSEEVASLADSSAADKDKWTHVGMDAIRNGQVAALVLSGGQGTRLGFSGPKGMYNIGLPSGKSLFELFALRLLKLQNESSGIIPWFIMTSMLNHETTVAFFEKNLYFGLKAAQVIFFSQGTLPCLTVEGKLMLETPSKLSRAPDGNGGIYRALVDSGALTQMETLGVKYLHVFSVDNAICKVADPVFLGYCIAKQADCGNKVVWKSRPEESVGVVAKRGGQYCVVEYSEMDKATSELRHPDTNQLLYGAANICNHFYSLEFLQKCCRGDNMNVYHVAHKKIPYVSLETGQLVAPSSNSGIKLEAFIFDVFQYATAMQVFEVTRDEEFAPVKNAKGNAVDSPDTACELISNAAKKWILAAGGSFDPETSGLCEVLPTVSYGGEGLKELVFANMKLPLLLDSSRPKGRRTSSASNIHPSRPEDNAANQPPLRQPFLSDPTSTSVGNDRPKNAKKKCVIQ
ncbi:hypothetical protein H310_06277 [Aphanomyces invadans]|uniref:UDP-N-acetylglucosamine diphosphorylase n=1 Tax=Aphanomyces invadans TaxID=157072 RepID=A0A024U6X7_9STRA|nr:hypothetical protein H310_06277 [Aphanomyces invadans]ETW01652.1 hypothetical protein H310_06277 [Aphanomyces invadans]|eukprot:XP_008869500.1 hypothetical protein H310_06277 [Aphanomyces invadans]